jgi:endoglucanase
MLLDDLIEVNGISGKEHEIRDIIIKELKKYVKDIKVDKFGNVIAHKNGKGAKVMLVAHMDEVGLMVKGIADNGHIICSAIGGIDPIAWIGQQVRVQAKKAYIKGVISHAKVNDSEAFESIPTLDDLYVDTGLDVSELKKSGVSIGSFVEPLQISTRLGSKDIVFGKALDDRVGCYILLELVRKLEKTDSDIYYVFTVQEEIGLYGAKTSVYKLDPDWAVVIDVMPANDAKEHSHEITRQIGKGPCITVKDSEMISNICIDEWLKDIAEKKNIPIQIDVSDQGTTDALHISVSKGGIPSTVVGVAIRNLHTAYSIAHMDDIKNAISLLEELLKKHPTTCLV